MINMKIRLMMLLLLFSGALMAQERGEHREERRKERHERGHHQMGR